MTVSIPDAFPKATHSRADVEIVAEQRRSLRDVIEVEVTEDDENWIITATFDRDKDNSESES